LVLLYSWGQRKFLTNPVPFKSGLTVVHKLNICRIRILTVNTSMKRTDPKEPPSIVCSCDEASHCQYK